MGFEVEIYNTLKGLVGNRIFPDVAPLSTQRPYITWQKIGGRSINYTDNTIPTEQHSRVQINVWADTRLSANNIAKQVEDALRQATNISAAPEAESMADHDPDLNLYGTIQDFSILSSR